MGKGLLWRGGLPPFGCAAVVKPVNAVLLLECWGSASHSNGGKPPRHRQARSPQGSVRLNNFVPRDNNHPYDFEISLFTIFSPSPTTV
ncbi:hypothetical protein FQ192_07555 [Pseudomonas sp. ANT_J12]|nr:hypothetical protein FQ192_07555 [Pseudomonas sp. ANT_J12]